MAKKTILLLENSPLAKKPVNPKKSRCWKNRFKRNCRQHNLDSCMDLASNQLQKMP